MRGGVRIEHGIYAQWVYFCSPVRARSDLSAVIVRVGRHFRAGRDAARDVDGAAGSGAEKQERWR